MSMFKFANFQKIMMIAAMTFTIGAFTAPVSADADHCPDKDNVNKVDGASGSKTVNGVTATWSSTPKPSRVIFMNTNGTSATVTWCAKGGTDFYNGAKNTGQQSTVVPAGQSVTVDISGKDISYFIAYAATLSTTTTTTTTDGGRGGGSTDVQGAQTSTPQSGGAGSQVAAPSGAVNAGAGGTEVSTPALFGLIVSMLGSGFGIRRFLKTQS